MARNLRLLAGRDLVYIDENQEQTPGTVMYLDSSFQGESLFEERERSYFFIPYTGESPFRISQRGHNCVAVSSDHEKIYGSSGNLKRVASERELEHLADFETGVLGSDPRREIQEIERGKLINILTKSPREVETGIKMHKSPLYSSFGFDSF